MPDRLRLLLVGSGEDGGGCQVYDHIEGHRFTLRIGRDAETQLVPLEYINAVVSSTSRTSSEAGPEMSSFDSAGRLAMWEVI